MSIMPYEFYEHLQDNEVVPYQMSGKSKVFLQKHPELFPSATEYEAISFTDFSIEFKHLEKNIDNYGDQLMNVSEAMVIQIQETEIDEETTLSELNLIDENGLQYYVLHLDSLNNIFKDDLISVMGLPLGMSSFENTGGGTSIVPIIKYLSNSL